MELQRGAEDVDTCRICRGEGSDGEPLFHPCKCSGSIMYVHQECLMTWLSHSQKKHCELCKTNFRFTKLYSPHMPEKLPTGIFFHRAALHVLATLLYWLRAVLVGATWLIWLPWSMRFVWWALLWVADAGWAADALQSHIPRNPSPVPAKSASLASYTFNMTFAAFPRTRSLSRRLWQLATGSHSATQSAYTLSNGTAAATSSTASASLAARGSLLSDVALFRNLTPYPLLNSFVMDVLEGQIITFSILTAVVLIFLIREWVVQQQPAMNWAAANDILQGDQDGQGAMDQNQPQDAAAGDDDEHDAPPSAGHDSLDSAIGDLQLPAPNFTDGDNDLPEGVEDDPPLWLAEEQSVQDLLNHLDTYHSEVAALAEPDHVPTGASRPRKIAQDLVLHIYSTHIAIGKACLVAHTNSDYETLAQLHERLVRLDNALSLLGETADRQRLAARLGHVRQWTSRVLERHRQQEASGGAPHASRASTVPSGEEDASQSVNQGEQTDVATSSSVAAHSPLSQSLHVGSFNVSDDAEQELDATEEPFSLPPMQGRPSMPMRNESFLATEIHRDLEESSSSPRPIVAAAASSASRGRGLEVEGENEHSGNIKQGGEEHASNNGSRSSDSFSLLDDDSAGPHSSTDPRNSHGAPAAAENVELDQSSSNHGLTPSSSNAELGAANATADDQGSKSLYRQLSDWMWGDVPAEVAGEAVREDDDLFHAIADVLDVDHEREHEHNDEQHDEQDGDTGDGQEEDQHGDAPVLMPEQELERVIAQAQEANANDADAAVAAADDIEDLEGLMELIGMQGNILGLFQNAVFMAVVGAVAITTSIWFPYLWGKLVLVFVAHPLHVAVRLPLELLSGTTNFAIDLCIWIGGAILSFIDTGLVVVYIFGYMFYSPGTKFRADTAVGRYAYQSSQQAITRISRLFMEPSDYIHLSASSHASLRLLQATFSSLLDGAKMACLAMYRQWMEKPPGFSQGALILASNVQTAGNAVWLSLKSLLGSVTRPATLTWTNAMTLQIQSSSPKASLSPGLAIWTGTDRSMAVLAGYAFFVALGAFYLTRLAPLATTRQAKRIEDAVMDVLQQAGGIIKVIIIISIEMLLFPVYCGALLDIATLPLFRGHSIEDRVIFTLNSPWTSAYTHWFIGTCYMFHLALFVSMCRKILRPGTIYFIRDPDDPTFHPVRDVLERNLASQMRKIVASATVYGGLVILFMGSVVWCLAATDWGILPIRWSSSEHVKGFPMDLLLYTALKPVIVSMWSPSSALFGLYKWCFGAFAAALRLRSFLLGGDMEADRRAWTAAGHSNDDGATAGPGRFVRVPNTDQARIPRGNPVFLEVDGDNNRLDGGVDHDEGTHGRKDVNFAMVYVPPFFRFRVILFILCLYGLTAAVGLGLSIAPLLIGRFAFSLVLPSEAHVTDIYAFVVGLCPIVAVAYADPQASGITQFFRRHRPTGQSLSETMTRIRRGASYAARFVYTYTALFVLIPSLLVLILDFYLVGPAHAYYAGPQQARTVPLLQSWTLGIQYLRVVKCVLEWNPESRPARAMNAVMERGWRDPNAGLVTRGFVVPIVLLACIALVGPVPLAWVASRLIYASHEADKRVQVIRFIYPALLAVALAFWLARVLLAALDRWRLRIRDEVYLIGERLHNFGEKKPPTFAHSSTTRISHA